MQGEQNFCEALNDDWIMGIILKKSEYPENYIFNHLLTYASGNIVTSIKPVLTEEKELKNQVDRFKTLFVWSDREVRRAYILAHEKIVLHAIRRGHLT